VARVDVSEARSVPRAPVPATAPRIKVDAPRAVGRCGCAPGGVRCADNLLNNALRYARVHCPRHRAAAATTVRLLVDDDGLACRWSTARACSTAFYRVQDDRGRGTGGAGLGWRWCRGRAAVAAGRCA